MIFDGIPIWIEGPLLSGVFLLAGVLLIGILSRKPSLSGAFILVAIGFGTLLRNTFGSRHLLLANPDALIEESISNSNVTFVRVGQMTTLLFLLFCISAIYIGTLHRQQRPGMQNVQLTIMGILVYIPVLISSLISEHGGFRYSLFFFPLFMVAIYFAPRISINTVYKTIQVVLLAFVYTSLGSILINPSWAMAVYSENSIGIPVRLFGTSAHPNSLGYISLACIIISGLQVKRNFWSYVHIVAAVITLVLSQSKTVWVAGVVWGVISLMLTKALPLNTRLRARLSLGMIVVGAFTLTYLLSQQGELMKEWFGQFSTLTGRTSVWDISIETWLENPLLGYGPNIWNLEFRLKFGYLYLWAGQAHNQILQTLGESGIFGLLSLTAYVYTLIKIISQNGLRTQRVSYGLVLLLIVRMLAEAPLRNYLIDESFLVHAILFTLLINSEETNLSQYLFSKKDVQLSVSGYA